MKHIANFENDNLFEFYAGRNELNRKKKFSENSGYPDDGGDYDNILLKDIYPLIGFANSFQQTARAVPFLEGVV